MSKINCSVGKNILIENKSQSIKFNNLNFVYA